jgi:hypothetical protein
MALKLKSVPSSSAAEPARSVRDVLTTPRGTPMEVLSASMPPEEHRQLLVARLRRFQVLFPRDEIRFTSDAPLEELMVLYDGQMRLISSGVRTIPKSPRLRSSGTLGSPDG